MTYNVKIIAAKVVQALGAKPQPFGGADSELRTSEGQVFHKSAIIYVNDDGSTLVNTGMAVTFEATKILFKDGRYNFVLTDGTKASFYADRGADIEIEEASASEEETTEEEEDETPAPKKRGKKAAPVVEEEEEEDEEEEEESDEEESDEEEEDDFEVPVRGKKPAAKAKAAPAKRGKKVVEEEDESDEEEEEEEDEAPAPKAKGKAKASSKVDWDNF